MPRLPPPPSRLLRLRADPAVKNIAWISADRAVRLLLSLSVGIAVARYLGPADFGRLGYALALTALLSTLPQFGLEGLIRQEFIRSPAQRGRAAATAYLVRLCAGAAAFLLLAGVAWLFAEPADRPVILLCGAALFQPAFLVVDAAFQARLDSRHSVVAQNAAAMAGALARLSLIFLGAPLRLFAATIALETLVGAVLLLRAYRIHFGEALRPRWDRPLAEALWPKAWPLLLSSMAVLVYMRIDQVMLEHLAGSAAVGVYTAALRLSETCYILPVAIAASFSPRLLAAKAKGPAHYRRSLETLFRTEVAVALALTLPLSLAAPWVIRWLFGPAYVETAAIFSWHVWALLFVALGVARSEALLAEGHQRFSLASTLAGAAINVPLNFWLIPLWGGKGAAIATLVSFAAAAFASSFAWSRTRPIGRLQAQALLLFWRPFPSGEPDGGKGARNSAIPLASAIENEEHPASRAPAPPAHE